MVGSDGEKSLTRTEYGIGTWGQSYHAKGLVCTVRTLQPHTIAFQRFLKTGPLAILPLWEDYSSIVWSLPSDLCQKMQDMDE
jgi:2-polyprenyl-6-methoxyphenol hydroxylase-like FAD-dependent oxidoreductase